MFYYIGPVAGLLVGIVQSHGFPSLPQVTRDFFQWKEHLHQVAATTLKK